MTTYDDNDAKDGYDDTKEIEHCKDGNPHHRNDGDEKWKELENMIEKRMKRWKRKIHKRSEGTTVETLRHGTLFDVQGKNRCA